MSQKSATLDARRTLFHYDQQATLVLTLAFGLIQLEIGDTDKLLQRAGVIATFSCARCGVNDNLPARTTIVSAVTARKQALPSAGVELLRAFVLDKGTDNLYITE
jgi:hypothetical protein